MTYNGWYDIKANQPPHSKETICTLFLLLIESIFFNIFAVFFISYVLFYTACFLSFKNLKVIFNIFKCLKKKLCNLIAGSNLEEWSHNQV